MPDHRPASSSSQTIIAQLAQPRRVQSLGPIAARFIYSLRLIALHDRARRDPIPELAMRLASVESAAKSLALAQTITHVWPENVTVSRFCCCALTHDEATIGTLIDAATARDRTAFDGTVQGFVRPMRIDALWDASVDLIAAELHAA